MRLPHVSPLLLLVACIGGSGQLSWRTSGALTVLAGCRGNPDSDRVTPPSTDLFDVEGVGHQLGVGSVRGTRLGRVVALAQVSATGFDDAVASMASGGSPRLDDEDSGSIRVIVDPSRAEPMRFDVRSPAPRLFDIGGSFGTLLSAGDLDGDGAADLVAVQAGYRRGVLPFGDSGTVAWTLPGPLDEAVVPHASGVRDVVADSLSIGDVDLDGRDDIVVTYPTLQIRFGADPNGPTDRAAEIMPPADGVESSILSSASAIVAASDGVAGVAVGWRYRTSIEDRHGHHGACLATQVGDGFQYWEAIGGRCWTGPEGGALGIAIAAVGDENGDGIDDFGVGVGAGEATAISDHEVYLLASDAPGDQELASAAFAILRGPDPQAEVGAVLVGGHDIDGDGVPDLVLGPGPHGCDGGVWIVRGPVTGTWDLDDIADRRLVGARDDARHACGFGTAIAVGDVDGDAKADLLIGEPDFDDGRGALWLVLGGDLYP
jgi:hypothetical protein